MHLGVGFTHTTAGDPPRVTTSIHVPLFRFAERDATLTGEGSTPPWLLLGREGGEIEVGVDATFTEDTPPPGDASLGGLGATLRSPPRGTTSASRWSLRDLQLPGAPSPRTFTLDVGSPEEILGDVLDLAAGLVRAQADALDLDSPTLRRFAGLTGLLGLREVGDLPALPLAELADRGLDALVDWAEDVVEDAAALDAWLAQLALLVGGTVDAANNAITLALDPFTLTRRHPRRAGHRRPTGAHPLGRAWRSTPAAGAAAQASVDLFRADTGSGCVHGVPGRPPRGVFGTEAGRHGPGHGRGPARGRSPHRIRPRARPPPRRRRSSG